MSRKHQRGFSLLEMAMALAIAGLVLSGTLTLVASVQNSGNNRQIAAELVDEYKIEIPVMRHDDKVFIRYSVNGFNSQADLDTLFDALREIMTEDVLLGSIS